MTEVFETVKTCHRLKLALRFVLEDKYVLSRPKVYGVTF